MKMPRPFLPLGIGSALLFCALNSPSPSSGQTPGDEQAISQLVAEIATQQAKLAANQQVIEQKLAAIEENMRLARIFVSRGGPANLQKK
ncbi:MAG: hypothetical protein ABMA01_02305 [Chthoniobacteraceae bacterium]